MGKGKTKVKVVEKELSRDDIGNPSIGIHEFLSGFSVYMPKPCKDSEAVFMGLDMNITDDITKADIVHFRGGSDINPELYGAKGNAGANHITNDIWDKLDDDAYDYAIKNKVFMTGFCRGAQYLCAKNGGNIIQHLNGHAGVSHNVDLLDLGYTVMVNSLHHQAMVNRDNAIILAVSSKKLSDNYSYEENNVVKKSTISPSKYGEEEAMYIPETMALGVQWHPEYETNEGTKPESHLNIFVHYLVKYFLECMNKED